MTFPWEFGGEFHWPEQTGWPKASMVGPIFPDNTQLFGSGRDALRALLEWGKRERGWRQAWIPSYFCSDVTPVIESCMERTEVYEDSPLYPAPLLPPEPTSEQDVVILVNFFGLRGPRAFEAFASSAATSIVDQSHDPWSSQALASRAGFCFASLRKTLPIPDGGALWSPMGNELPHTVPATDERRIASHLKLSAMVLKAAYLAGGRIDKDQFRTLQIEGEQGIASGEVSGATELVRELLKIMPYDSWREARRSNWEFLASALRAEEGIRVLEPYDEEAYPFSLVVDLGTKKIRNYVRSRLIEESIYTAVLWPLDESRRDERTRAAIDLSHRLLSVPCDFRYSEEDLSRVARCITAAIRSDR